MATLSKKKLKEILAVNGMQLVDNYNYNCITIHCDVAKVGEVTKVLKTNKEIIEKAYRLAVNMPEWSLLPEVVVPRPKSVWVPTPFETQINTISNIIADYVDGIRDVQLPYVD